MKLLTAEIRERLLRNGRVRQEFQMDEESERAFQLSCTLQPACTKIRRADTCNG